MSYQTRPKSFELECPSEASDFLSKQQIVINSLANGEALDGAQTIAPARRATKQQLAEESSQETPPTPKKHLLAAEQRAQNGSRQLLPQESEVDKEFRKTARGLRKLKSSPVIVTRPADQTEKHKRAWSQKVKVKFFKRKASQPNIRYVQLPNVLPRSLCKKKAVQCF